MRFWVGLAVASLTLVGYAGCVEDGTAASTASPISSIRAMLNAMIHKDVEGVLRYVSDSWVDLGGGDGTPYTKAERRQSLKSWFASDEYAELFRDVNRPEDMVDFGQLRMRTYNEFRADYQEYSDRFVPRAGDIEVSAPWAATYDEVDGLFGMWRSRGSIWVEVAGD